MLLELLMLKMLFLGSTFRIAITTVIINFKVYVINVMAVYQL